jgi:hypothetical protein
MLLQSFGSALSETGNCNPKSQQGGDLYVLQQKVKQATTDQIVNDVVH